MPTVVTDLGPATFSLAPVPDWDDGEDDEAPDYSSSGGDCEDVIINVSVARKRSKKGNTSSKTKKRKVGDTANIPAPSVGEPPPTSTAAYTGVPSAAPCFGICQT